MRSGGKALQENSTQLKSPKAKLSRTWKKSPETALTIKELMHNKMKGDPLRLVLPEAENQLLSVYR